MSIAAVEGLPLGLIWLLSGCVIGRSGFVELDEPIERAEIEIARGSIEVVGTNGPGNVSLDLAGFGGVEPSPPAVLDGVLTIVDPCGGVELCFGDLRAELPPEVELVVNVREGDLFIANMAGRLTAEAGGRVQVRRHQGAVVSVRSESGQRMELSFERPIERVTALITDGPMAVAVPPGRYALDVEAAGGAVLDPEIEIDPESKRTLVLTSEAGVVAVQTR